MRYEEVDSENTDIPESVRRERRIRKANEERPLRPEEVSEAYETGNFNHLADRYEELGYDTLAKQYRNKNKNVHKRNIINVIIPYLSFIVLAVFIVIGARNYERDKTSSLNETYVETQVETEPAIDEPEVSKWVTTTRVKVRTEPNTNCDVLGVLDAGVQIDYTGDANEEWVTIDYNGQEAYVYKKYIQELINNEVYNSEEIPETSAVETSAVETSEVETSEVETSEVETSDIMSQAQDLSVKYKDVARNPNQYIGQTFYVTYYVDDMRVEHNLGIKGRTYYTGYYFDVDEFESNQEYFNSLGGNYNYYDNPSLISASTDKPIWLMEKRSLYSSDYTKILKGDVIKAYGIFTGMIETKNSITGEHGEIMGLDLYSVEIIYG